MIESMNRGDYDEFISLKEIFEYTIVACAQDICRSTKSRELEGVWDEDIELWDPDRYFVQFESYSCGETNYDSVFVPVRYIYDIEYRLEYKKILIEEHKAEVLKRQERKKNRLGRIYNIVTGERAEYERLKAKFGD